MNKKRILVMSTLLILVAVLSIGTYSYFRRTVNGNITGQTGNLSLIVNEVNSVANETFSVSLNRSEEEPFVMPDDAGVFNLNIDTTGSSGDVAATITISRIDLPENLKFYLDEAHIKELTSKRYIIKKSNNMTKTVPIYWFWNGSVDDINDTLYMNKTISANVSVNVTLAKTFYDTLLAMDYTLDKNVDFIQGASSTNGEGLMMVNATQNDEYPVVYYRGDVNNNNAIYAGFCWLIVRTTDTGGVKLIYNGEVNSDGSCNNYSNVTASKPYDRNVLGAYLFETTVAYNDKQDSPVYVGYMYNDTNKFYTYSDIWSDGFSYSYLDEKLDADGYVAHLADNAIDQATGRHVQNLRDSSIKEVVDDWYKETILGKPEEGLLEDTVWCNDRSITSTMFAPGYYNEGHGVFGYSAFTRVEENSAETPSLSCNRNIDKFTVNTLNGNGDLTYPVGMLTADEIIMAGNAFTTEQEVVITYLTTPLYHFWTMSPSFFASGAYTYYLSVGMYDSSYSVATIYCGVRASISLGYGAIITSGNGSFEQPYIVG